MTKIKQPTIYCSKLINQIFKWHCAEVVALHNNWVTLLFFMKNEVPLSAGKLIVDFEDRNDH
jgi:hypothetical protein